MKSTKLVVPGLLVAMAFLHTACAAQTEAKRVGLVVSFTDMKHCVQCVEIFGDTAMIYPETVLSASSFAAEILDSGFGKSVCGLSDGDGENSHCTKDDCFCDPDHYWALFTSHGGNGFEWSAPLATGISDTEIAEKSLVGFRWTGFDSEFNPVSKPKITTFEDVCAGSSTEMICEPDLEVQ